SSAEEGSATQSLPLKRPSSADATTRYGPTASVFVATISVNGRLHDVEPMSTNIAAAATATRFTDLPPNASLHTHTPLRTRVLRANPLPSTTALLDGVERMDLRDVTIATMTWVRVPEEEPVC